MIENPITRLFKINHPIIQGGMIWHSGWKLASAVSLHGGLGLLGAGSMYPDVFLEHVLKMKKACDEGENSVSWGVNIPLLYPNIEDLIDISIREGVKIVFTSAGNPAQYTSRLKAEGITVVHVVSSTKFAMKAEAAGVDAVVAEGFEAGGHNGREETTTLSLIPAVCDAVKIPVITAGGIATGRQMFAAMSLGADAVQIGSAFAATQESSGHPSWKEKITSMQEGGTALTLKELAPVRLVKNKLYEEFVGIYKAGGSVEDLKEHLGRGRAKAGMFLGDLEEGELEIGQASNYVKEILSVETLMHNILQEYEITRVRMVDKR